MELPGMKHTPRRITKWTLRLVLILMALAALYVVVLVFPSPLFAYSESYGSYRVYSDEPMAADFGLVIADLDRRIQEMEHAPRDAGQRIYLCGPQKFRFFALLTRKNPLSLGIGLSLANESFVSTERVRLFADSNGGVLRHTRFEGSIAEVVAHEVAHFHSARALGFRAHLAQPLWKSEGWAEYQANLAAIRADPGYDLRTRIDQLLDDGYWGGGHGFARRMWEAQLLVEFLGEVKGYRLSDLVPEEITEAGVRAEMMDWYRQEREGPGSAIMRSSSSSRAASSPWGSRRRSASTTCEAVASP